MFACQVFESLAGGSINFIWNQFNENQDLINLSAMISAEKLSLDELGLSLNENSISKKLNFPLSELKMDNRHCNLIMVGNSFSLGMESLHNDLIDEFEQAIEVNSTLNY